MPRVTPVKAARVAPKKSADASSHLSKTGNVTVVKVRAKRSAKNASTFLGAPAKAHPKRISKKAPPKVATIPDKSAPKARYDYQKLWVNNLGRIRQKKFYDKVKSQKAEGKSHKGDYYDSILDYVLFTLMTCVLSILR